MMNKLNILGPVRSPNRRPHYYVEVRWMYGDADFYEWEIFHCFNVDGIPIYFNQGEAHLIMTPDEIQHCADHDMPVLPHDPGAIMDCIRVIREAKRQWHNGRRRNYNAIEGWEAWSYDQLKTVDGIGSGIVIDYRVRYVDEFGDTFEVEVEE